MIAWLLISFFVLLFLGVPIAMSLGLSAIGGILFLGAGSTGAVATAPDGPSYPERHQIKNVANWQRFFISSLPA